MQDLHEMPVQWFERVWNQKDESAIDELLSKETRGYGLGPVIQGPEDFKVFYRRFLTAFPDIQVKTEQVIVEGDWTVARIRATGTHTGPLDNIAPSNKSIDIDAIIMTQWSNGQIVHSHNSVDMLTLLQQIGAIPT